MIKVIQNQSLLDIAVSSTGSVLSIFDFALINGLSITEVLEPGQIISNIQNKEYDNIDFHDFYKSFIKERRLNINVIQNQSLLDISIQNDGSILSVFDYAIKNNISITEFLHAGQVIKLPSVANLEYRDLANHFKDKNILIATRSSVINNTVNDLQYYFPLEFPISF